MNENIICVPLADVYLVLKDYKEPPILAASSFRFTKTNRSLSPNETVYRQGTLQLVYSANETNKIQTDVGMGIFLDDTPIYAVKLNQQHEWEMVGINRATFQPFCTQEGLLLQLRDADNTPLAGKLPENPDELLLFFLGSPELDKHYPDRINFVTEDNLYIIQGDPVLLDPKPQSSGFTVLVEERPGIGIEHIVRADRHLFTLLAFEGGGYLLGGGKWTNEQPRYSFVPVLAQLYRKVTKSCFIPFFLDDGCFEHLVNEETYLKRIDGYITELDERNVGQHPPCLTKEN